MQFLLAYFFLSWLFFTISSTQIDLSSSPIDLFHDDSQLFAAEPQLGEAESLDQSFASDSNLFSDDYQLLSADEPDPDYLLPDIDLNQFAESDPSLLAAGDTACESSDATDPQLFGKIQGRGDTCKAPPRGEAGGLPPQPDDGDQLTDLGFTNFATNRRTMSVFPRNYDICPYEKYSGANIPVCKEPNLADVSQVQGVPWFNLRNVVPRTFCRAIIYIYIYIFKKNSDLVNKYLLIKNLQQFTGTET